MGGFIVDRSLICKAFLECGANVSRVCLPWGFGKTLNLSVLEQFLNVVTVHDCPEDDVDDTDLCQARKQRERRFACSILKQNHPEFFEKHFARYPVIRIDFTRVSHDSSGCFSKRLARAVHNAATFWIDAYDYSKLVNESARTKYDILREQYASLAGILRGDDERWESSGHYAASFFKCLSEFVAAQHSSQYIVLIDEHDKPLRGTFDGEWHFEARVYYLRLLMCIFNSNKYLKAGLLVGQYDLPLLDMVSGASIKSVAITARCTRWHPVSTENRPKCMPGQVALAASFGFTRQDLEFLTLRVWETSVHARRHRREHIISVLALPNVSYDFGLQHLRHPPLTWLCFFSA